MDVYASVYAGMYFTHGSICAQVSKSLQMDQQRIQEEFGNHVAETEKVFEDVVARLKDEHTAELRRVLRDKAEVSW